MCDLPYQWITWRGDKILQVVTSFMRNSKIIKNRSKFCTIHIYISFLNALANLGLLDVVNRVGDELPKNWWLPPAGGISPSCLVHCMANSYNQSVQAVDTHFSQDHSISDIPYNKWLRFFQCTKTSKTSTKHVNVHQMRYNAPKHAKNNQNM